MGFVVDCPRCVLLIQGRHCVLFIAFIFLPDVKAFSDSDFLYFNKENNAFTYNGKTSPEEQTVI